MHPILFQIGDTAVPGYGVLVTLAMVIGLTVALLLARKCGLPVMETATFLLLLVMVSLAGAKAYLMIFHAVKLAMAGKTVTLAALLQHKSMGVFYGGYITGIFFSIWYLKKVGLPLWKVSDIIPAAALMHAVGRVGCFLGGCCFGRPSSVPWAVQFPGHLHAVHPTQLYEALLNLVNFGVLLFALRRKRFDGQIFCLYIINYSVIRYAVELFRGGPGRGYVFEGGSPWTSLSVPQLISLLGLAAASALWYYLGNRERAE
jgi:phosphatidylglycerol:prolipoprotein diacylglycerol transferase